jgi:hypothetical protein
MQLIHDAGAHLYHTASMPQQLPQIPIRGIRSPDPGDCFRTACSRVRTPCLTPPTLSEMAICQQLRIGLGEPWRRWPCP